MFLIVSNEWNNSISHNFGLKKKFAGFALEFVHRLYIKVNKTDLDFWKLSNAKRSEDQFLH